MCLLTVSTRIAILRQQRTQCTALTRAVVVDIARDFYANTSIQSAQRAGFLIYSQLLHIIIQSLRSNDV